MFYCNLSLMKLILLLLSMCLTTKAQENATAVQSTELDAAKCEKKRTGCCEQLYLGDETVAMKCLTLHRSKMPEGDIDPVKAIHFVSCFAECQYKIQKYIGKGDNINMKMVKNDAAKLFPDRPKEKDYHIKSFEFCSKDGGRIYSAIKTNPGGRVLLMNTCKPYFLFVYLCMAEYHKKQSCPYFRWQGKPSTPAEESCEEDKNKCYELNGIAVPSKN